MNTDKREEGNERNVSGLPHRISVDLLRLSVECRYARKWFKHNGMSGKEPMSPFGLAGIHRGHIKTA